MLDARFPEDTLFLYCEGDHRVYECDLFQSGDTSWNETGFESFAARIRQAAKEEAERQASSSKAGAVDSKTEETGTEHREAEPSGAAPVVPKVESPQGGASGDFGAGSNKIPSASPSPPKEVAPPPPVAETEVKAEESASASSAAQGCNREPEASGSREPEASGTREPEASDRAYHGWDPVFPETPPSPEIKDVVHVCTWAKRVGAGNMLWMQWEGGFSRQMPGHGSGMLALTRAFARDFLPHLQSTAPGHVDLVLKEWLDEDGRQENGEYGFLYPTFGSFETHTSGCDVAMGTRPSNFNKPWSGNGFHCEKGPRFIGRLRQKGKGGAQWLGGPIDWSCDLRWRTERPPCHWADPRWAQRLWNRWWLDRHGEWVGPVCTWEQQRMWDRATSWSRRPWQARGKDGEELHAGNAALKNDPDGYRFLKGGGQAPITRLAEALVTTPQHDDRWEGEQSHRTLTTRRRRTAVANYCRRVFDDDGQDRNRTTERGRVERGGVESQIDMAREPEASSDQKTKTKQDGKNRDCTAYMPIVNMYCSFPCGRPFVSSVSLFCHLKEDVGWECPHETDLPQQLSFPGQALAMKQLYNRALWDHFLGADWYSKEVGGGRDP